MVNSLWPSDTIWHHRSLSALFQVMACCLLGPSHYLNLWWLIVNWILRNKPQWDSNKTSAIFIHENRFENVVCKMFAISLMLQCVNYFFVSTVQFRVSVQYGEDIVIGSKIIVGTIPLAETIQRPSAPALPAAEPTAPDLEYLMEPAPPYEPRKCRALRGPELRALGHWKPNGALMKF